MSEKKKYDLMFVYRSTSEIYRDNLLLTDTEVDSLNLALEALVENGDIYGPDGDHNAGEMLVEYSGPRFITLDILKQGWRDGFLQDRLDDIEFVWPGAKE